MTNHCKDSWIINSAETGEIATVLLATLLLNENENEKICFQAAKYNCQILLIL